MTQSIDRRRRRRLLRRRNRIIYRRRRRRRSKQASRQAGKLKKWKERKPINWNSLKIEIKVESIAPHAIYLWMLINCSRYRRHNQNDILIIIINTSSFSSKWKKPNKEHNNRNWKFEKTKRRDGEARAFLRIRKLDVFQLQHSSIATTASATRAACRYHVEYEKCAFCSLS